MPWRIWQVQSASTRSCIEVDVLVNVIFQHFSRTEQLRRARHSSLGNNGWHTVLQVPQTPFQRHRVVIPVWATETSTRAWWYVLQSQFINGILVWQQRQVPWFFSPVEVPQILFFDSVEDTLVWQLRQFTPRICSEPPVNISTRMCWCRQRCRQCQLGDCSSSPIVHVVIIPASGPQNNFHLLPKELGEKVAKNALCCTRCRAHCPEC